MAISQLTQDAIEKAEERSRYGLRDMVKGTYHEEVAREVMKFLKYDRSRSPEMSDEIRLAFIAEVIAIMQSHRADQIHHMDLTY